MYTETEKRNDPKSNGCFYTDSSSSENQENEPHNNQQRPKINKERKNISSMSIFMRFVKFPKRKNEECDVSQMFSKECYESWVKTRKVFPKKPSESYRRVLTSHCRGSEGRRPFPEMVERKVLEVIRKKHQWPCFSDEKDCRIGVHGFHGQGYHEEKRKAQISAETQSKRQRISTTEPLKRLDIFASTEETNCDDRAFEDRVLRNLSVENPKSSFADKSLASLPQSCRTSKENTSDNEITMRPYSFQTKRKNSFGVQRPCPILLTKCFNDGIFPETKPISGARYIENTIERMNDLISSASESLAKNLASALCKFYTREQFRSFLLASRDLRIGLFNSKVLKLSEESKVASDPRYTSKFLSVPASSRMFNAENRQYKAIVEVETFMVVDCEDGFHTILRRNILGGNFLDCFDPIMLMAYLPSCLLNLKVSGEHWARTELLAGHDDSRMTTGTRVICLLYHRLVTPSSIEIVLQDVSHQHQHFLSLPRHPIPSQGS